VVVPGERGDAVARAHADGGERTSKLLRPGANLGVRVATDEPSVTNPRDDLDRGMCGDSVIDQRRDQERPVLHQPLNPAHFNDPRFVRPTRLCRAHRAPLNRIYSRGSGGLPPQEGVCVLPDLAGLQTRASEFRLRPLTGDRRTR
jgi:hypothetical protein